MKSYLWVVRTTIAVQWGGERNIIPQRTKSSVSSLVVGSIIVTRAYIGFIVFLCII